MSKLILASLKLVYNTVTLKRNSGLKPSKNYIKLCLRRCILYASLKEVDYKSLLLTNKKQLIKKRSLTLMKT